MMLNFRFLYLIISIAVLSNCAQLSIYQTARTEGKGNLTITPVVEGNSLLERGAGTSTSATLPSARAEISYGIRDNLDITANISSYASLLTSLKYRILGNNDSPFAMAVMPGYEYQVSLANSGISVSRLHFPLIFSYFSSEQLGYFISPKYTLQVQEGSENISYPGFSAGINLKMARVDYTIGASGFFPFSTLAGATNGQIYQFGVGARIPLIRYRN